MATAAFSGGLTVEIGDDVLSGTPTYSAIGEVQSLSGLGQTNELVDVTNFDSGGSKEYIGGLADGQEISIEANYVALDAGQIALIGYVGSKTNVAFKLVVTDGTTTHTYTMDVAPLSWVVNPSQENQNTISFTMKISGNINKATS
jgi:hypothetical protein